MRRKRGSIISFTALIMCVYVGLRITVTNFANKDDRLTWGDLLSSDSSPANVSQNPSVVLFTTFKNQPDRMFLQYNTLRNWASLRPFVQPVLFTTSQHGDGNDMLEQVARESGWHLYPAPAVNSEGLPFVRPMFEQIERKYSDVMFRGYSNGDLLYDDSLMRTLSVVLQHIAELNHTVLFGNHTICAGNPVNMNVNNKDFLRKWAAESSTVNRNGTKAYVILNGLFPWEKFPGLVVGRRGFDNFLVNFAEAHGATAVDVTLSLLAVHQPATGGAVSKLAKDLDYNEKVVASATGLAKVNMTNTTSARCETRKDFLGNVYLVDRPKPDPPKKTKKKRVPKSLKKTAVTNGNKESDNTKKDAANVIKSDTKVDKKVENKDKTKIANKETPKDAAHQSKQPKGPHVQIKQDADSKAGTHKNNVNNGVVKH